MTMTTTKKRARRGLSTWALVALLCGLGFAWYMVTTPCSHAQFDGPVSGGSVSPSTDLEVNSLGVGSAASGSTGQICATDSLQLGTAIVSNADSGCGKLVYNSSWFYFKTDSGDASIFASGLQSYYTRTDAIRDRAGTGPVTATYGIKDGTADDSTITANTTLTSSQYTVRIDTSGGSNITITLPAVASSAGQQYRLKVIGYSGTITLAAQSGEYIDGANTYTGLSALWDAVNLVCDGTRWLVF